MPLDVKPFLRGEVIFLGTQYSEKEISTREVVF